MNFYHSPVLLEETITSLAPRSEAELMVDATVGEGGHSEAFLQRFPGLRLIAVDIDSNIQARARQRLAVFGDRVLFYQGWAQDFFADFDGTIKRPDMILIDLGISLFHYEASGRGFSFKKNEKLDMRLNPKQGPSAAELVARLSETELADLIYRYSEERYSRRIANAIVEARQAAPILSTASLAEIVSQAVPSSYLRQPLHPATRTFQALRIAVNGELSRLNDLLAAAFRVLELGGRLAVISFHSLEDRIVKNFFRDRYKDCSCPPSSPICRCKGKRSVVLLTRKAVVPSPAEIERNPAARSAKLRAVQKILDEDVA